MNYFVIRIRIDSIPGYGSHFPVIDIVLGGSRNVSPLDRYRIGCHSGYDQTFRNGTSGSAKKYCIRGIRPSAATIGEDSRFV